MIELQDHPNDLYTRSNVTQLQLLYWVGQTLRPDTPLFNVPRTLTISTDVRREHFESAFQALLDHSDALRTVIEEKGGSPRQRVISDVPHQLEYVDLSDRSDPQLALEEWVEERSVIPLAFDTRLFDSALIKLSAEQFVWYLNVHHIIADASSFFVMEERLADFYDRSLHGRSLEAPEASNFVEYVEYERAYRDRPQYSRAERYWDQKLTPGPEPIKFYGEAPKKKTFQVERRSYNLGAKRSQQLRELVRDEAIFMVSEELSLYNLFATLFFAQLHLTSGNRRLGFMAPVHNRFTSKFRKIIGLVMELCPVQITVSDDETFLSLITKMKRETRETLTYYQGASGRTLDTHVFDVMFNLYRTPELTFADAPAHAERIHTGYGSESLVLHVNDDARSGRFELHFDFHCDVFNEMQRDEIMQSFLGLVDAVLDDLEHPIRMFRSQAPAAQHLRSDGDVDRQAVQEPDRSRSEWYSALVSTRDPVEFQLLQIWEEVLDVRPIDVQDNFFDLGGSSWLAVQLFSKIEDATGKNLPLATLLKAATIEDQARLLREEGWVASWSSLVPIKPNGSRPPFFCVHGGGGNVLHYRTLAHHLGPDRPFYGLQPRGMDGTQPFHTSVEEMAGHYIEELQMVQPEGPYHIGGYCFGATVAFEMAHQLRRAGHTVGLLTAIEGATHDYPELMGSAFERARDHLASLRRLDTKETVAYIRERVERRVKQVLKRTKKRLRKFEIVRKVYPDIGEPLARPPHHQRMVKALNRAFRNYQPEVYPGRLVVFRMENKHDHHLGWDGLAAEGVDVHIVPGNQTMDVFKEPHVRGLAEQLRAELDAVQPVEAGAETKVPVT